MKQRRLDALHPLGALVDQRVTQPRARAPLADVLGRDPGLRQPAVGEQLAQPPGVLAVGLGAALATPQRARLDRLGQMRLGARGDQRVTHEQPAGARLDRDPHLPLKAPDPRASTAAGVASIRPRLTSPVSVSSASNVICLRCTSNPATIAIRASSAFRQLPPREPSRVEPKEARSVHAIFARDAIASGWASASRMPATAQRTSAAAPDWRCLTVPGGPCIRIVQRRRLGCDVRCHPAQMGQEYARRSRRCRRPRR